MLINITGQVRKTYIARQFLHIFVPAPYFQSGHLFPGKLSMNQRLNLFNAGYCAYNPALYYGQKALVQEFSASEDEMVKKQIELFSKSSTLDPTELQSNIRTVIDIAKKFEIKPLKEPVDHSTYFDWRENLTEQFESQYPMSRIDHYYFLYSRKLAEIYSNLGLAEKLLGVKHEIEGESPIDRKIDKYFKDSEYILFKLIAAAALLSSEPRQNCFNQHYRHLNQEYQQFRNIELKDLNKDKITLIRQGLTAYQQDVDKAIKGCLGVLQELGV